MKYFIGYLIKGNTKRYQEELIEKVCKKFEVKNLNEHIPAHLTLKSPFETENISEIEKFLEKFCKNKKSFNIEIIGISNFVNRVIFLDFKSTKKSEEFSKKLLLELEKTKWINFSEHDKKEDIYMQH